MIDIVFSSDQNFISQLLVSSASAVHASRNSTERINVHILDCGISDDAWQEYSDHMHNLAKDDGKDILVTRHVVDMSWFASVPAWTNGSKATWARILLPEILKGVQYCIYSDCDVLFIEDPSELVQELNASGVSIIGHKNPFGSISPDAKWFKEKKLPFDENTYFCAGLIAMDLSWMREQNIVAKCWEFLRQFPDPVSVDQTVLNAVCNDSKGLLSDGWGLFTHECYIAKGRIKAVHFSGGCPWIIPKVTYDALYKRLSAHAASLWYAFQAEILRIEVCNRVDVKMMLRVKALIILFGCRVLNILHLSPSRLKCLLELVSSFDGKSKEISIAKKTMLS